MPHAKRSFFHKILSFFIFVCLVLMLIDPETVILSVRDSLKVCYHSIVPSLLPFTVISELLIACGAGEAAGAVFSGAMHRLFGISGAGSCSVFLGSVCGFPIGAKTAVSMYDKGILSKRETEHLLTFSNNPSAAFLIGGVGVTMLGNKTAGIVIYASSLVAATLTGIAGRYILRPESSGRIGSPHPYPYAKSTRMLTDAISSAAASSISVCCCVIFFSALINSLTSLPFAGDLPPLPDALIHGFFELSGGMSLASRLPGRILPATACAMIAGWSGISVHTQVFSVCGGRGLSLKPYLISKLAQSLVSAALTAGIFAAFPKLSLPDTKEVIGMLTPRTPGFLPGFALILLIFAAIIGVYTLSFSNSRR